MLIYVDVQMVRHLLTCIELSHLSLEVLNWEMLTIVHSFDWIGGCTDGVAGASLLLVWSVAEDGCPLSLSVTAVTSETLLLD